MPIPSDGVKMATETITEHPHKRDWLLLAFYCAFVLGCALFLWVQVRRVDENTKAISANSHANCLVDRRDDRLFAELTNGFGKLLTEAIARNETRLATETDPVLRALSQHAIKTYTQLLKDQPHIVIRSCPQDKR